MIRRAVASDAAPLLTLMRELARFERYDDRFAVGERDLVERGLAPDGARQFMAFVADAGAALIGYAVVVEIPFTFDLRPTVLLKELYVDARHRAAGVGRALFEHVREHARNRGAGRIVWTVLPDNAAAQAFYRQAGGAPDAAWQHWQLPLIQADDAPDPPFGVTAATPVAFRAFAGGEPPELGDNRLRELRSL